MTSPAPTRAEFNPLSRRYLVMTIGFTMLMTIALIPFAIIWFLGVGQWWARHYFDKLECELNERTLRYRKGILTSRRRSCVQSRRVSTTSPHCSARVRSACVAK